MIVWIGPINYDNDFYYKPYKYLKWLADDKLRIYGSAILSDDKFPNEYILFIYNKLIYSFLLL